MVVKSGKPKASHSQAVGRARQARVASVTTASVPSEPMRSLLRSGPAAERGTGRQAQDLAVRQDRGQPEQHVLDRAEPGGGLPGGRRGDPAADGGDRDRLRVVAGGQPELGQFLLQPVAAHPGLDLDRMGDDVDLADAVHPGQVEDDGVGVGLRPAADAGARAPRDDRGAGFRWPRPGSWRPPRCGPGRAPRRVRAGRRRGPGGAAPAARSRSRCGAASAGRCLWCRRAGGWPGSPGSSPGG